VSNPFSIEERILFGVFADSDLHFHFSLELERLLDIAILDSSKQLRVFFERFRLVGDLIVMLLMHLRIE
jgi:hypothetical protein